MRSRSGFSLEVSQDARRIRRRWSRTCDDEHDQCDDASPACINLILGHLGAKNCKAGRHTDGAGAEVYIPRHTLRRAFAAGIVDRDRKPSLFSVIIRKLLTARQQSAVAWRRGQSPHSHLGVYCHCPFFGKETTLPPRVLIAGTHGIPNTSDSDYLPWPTSLVHQAFPPSPPRTKVRPGPTGKQGHHGRITATLGSRRFYLEPELHLSSSITPNILGYLRLPA